MLTLTALCKDLAGNQGGASDTVQVDMTPPSIAVAVLSQPNANGWYNANFTATCSGAMDKAGNAAPPVSVSYTVNYTFVGLLQPVDNAPTVNTGRAGKTYPVQFQLTNASGAYISTLSAVRSITANATTCGA